jgi:hypothetical protein
LRQLTDLGDHGEWNSNSSEAIARGASFESVLMMKSDAKTPSVTVGVFDHVQDLERAVERLAAAGFEDTLYNEAIVALDAGDVATVGRVPIPVVAPGVVATEASGSVEPDLPTIVRAFKSHLADYHLPDQVIEDYAMAFYHEGKVVLVRTRDEAVVRILRECGASQVNRFD